MKQKYAKPEVDLITFVDDVIATSMTGGITKNPGNHSGCEVMPNGKPIPENAEGYRKNH